MVEDSNLQRQVIHGQSDRGRPKVDSAAEAIAELNPHVRVVRHQVRLDRSNALELFAGYHLVLDGTDNFATRYLVDDACAVLGLPLVWGSVLRFDGQVSVFWSKRRSGTEELSPGEERGVTYRDLHPTPPPPGSVPSCAEGGVLGVVCAAIGSVMATEAVKLICGIGEPLLGRLMIFDALAMSWRTIKVRPAPDARPVTELLPDYDAFCGVPTGSASIRPDGSVLPGPCCLGLCCLGPCCLGLCCLGLCCPVLCCPELRRPEPCGSMSIWRTRRCRMPKTRSAKRSTLGSWPIGCYDASAGRTTSC